MAKSKPPPKIAQALRAAKPKFARKIGSYLPSECLIVATGRIQWYKKDAYTLVKTKSAEVRVLWAGKMLPPSVYVGKTVHFIGRFQTFQDGKVFRVVDALPLDGNYREIMRPVIPYFYHFAQDPRDWAEQESLDRLLIMDVE